MTNESLRPPPPPPHQNDEHSALVASPPLQQVTQVPVPLAYQSHPGHAKVPQLTGPNFQSWKELIEIVLTLKGLKQALTSENVDLMVDLQAKLVMLESMDESHRAQTRGCTTSKEVMARLELVYADNSAANVYRLLNKFYKYVKVESDSMSVHLGRMDEMKRSLEAIGEKITETLYQVVILGSLPEEYKSMMEVWELTHPDMRKTANLVARLLKKEEDVLDKAKNVSGFSVRHQYNLEERKKQLDERRRNSKCHKCQELGHWARECPRQPAQRQNLTFGIGRFDESFKSRWIIDSGASTHMANNKEWFTTIRFFGKPERATVGDGSEVEILGEGDIEVESKVGPSSYRVTMKQVQFIPSLATNLFSVGAASRQSGVLTNFDGRQCTLSSNGKPVGSGFMSGNLYIMNVRVVYPAKTVMVVRNERSTNEWHGALGHPSEERVRALAKTGIIKAVGPLDDCGNCAAGKAKHSTHPSREAPRSEIPGERVFCDLAQFDNKDSEYPYYFLCKDEATEYCFIYPLKRKSDATPALMQMCIDFEIGSGRRVKQINSDNGSELKNHVCRFELLKQGIDHRFSAPYEPQQNSIAEREIQNINSMARTMLVGNAHIPCVESVRTACYLRNRLPTKRSNKTPYERFRGHSPNLDNLVEFGSPAHVLINGKRLAKLEQRTMEGFQCGYTSRSNTYRIFVPCIGRVVETSDVVFKPHVTKRESAEIKRIDEHAEVPLTKHQEMSVSDTPQDCPSVDTNRAEGDKRLEVVVAEPQSQTNEIRYNKKGQPLVSGDQLVGFFESFRLNNLGSERQEDEEMSGEQSGLARETNTSTDAPPSPPTRNSSFEFNSCLSMSQEDEKLSETLVATPRIDFGGTCVLAAPSGEPASYRMAMLSDKHEEWKGAIKDELDAHRSNGTWSVCRRPDKKTLSAKWVFVIKRDKNGQPIRYKARLVARGFEQKFGVDYFDTYAPVAKAESLRVLMAIAAAQNYHLAQFDVATAFLNGELEEEVFLEAPAGVEVEKDHCLKLHKSLYGLKQSPKCWNSKLDTTLKKLGLQPTISDPCVYVSQSKAMIVLIYVDDGIVASKIEEDGRQLIKRLDAEFKTKEMEVGLFLGIEIEQDGKSICLSQQRYIEEMVDRFNLTEADGETNPVADLRALKAANNLQSKQADAPYLQLIGSLQYCASKTRPDISFIVNFLSRYNKEPKEAHWLAAKRVLKYLKATKGLKMKFMSGKLEVTAFSDADFANNEDDRTSTSGFIILMAGSAVIFGSRKQTNTALSTAEAEYIAACEVSRELKWLRTFLQELGTAHATPWLFVDNKSAQSQIGSGESKSRSKHVDIRYHFVREQLKKGLFTVGHVESQNQLADILTKSVSGPRLKYILNKCGLL